MRGGTLRKQFVPGHASIRRSHTDDTADDG